MTLTENSSVVTNDTQNSFDHFEFVKHQAVLAHEGFDCEVLFGFSGSNTNILPSLTEFIGNALF